MSTRGAIVFVKGGVEEIYYNHCDSYPSGLGQEVANYVSELVIGTKTEQDRFSLIPEDDRKRHKTAARAWMADSLFNEWSYVIDFDQRVVEVYKGFQHSAHTRGRYHMLEGRSEYFPVALINKVSFDSPFLKARVTSEKEDEDLAGLADFVDQAVFGTEHHVDKGRE